VLYSCLTACLYAATTADATAQLQCVAVAATRLLHEAMRQPGLVSFSDTYGVDKVLAFAKLSTWCNWSAEGWLQWGGQMLANFTKCQSERMRHSQAAAIERCAQLHSYDYSIHMDAIAQ
jgi:hypothetical protein